MKKGLIILAIIIAIIVGGAAYLLSGAGDLIKEQIEKQGSKFLGTQVTVFNVDLAISEGRLTINDIDVENPQGFSDEDAFSLDGITLDLGQITGEPYTVDAVRIDAPEILYEFDASGKGNLLVLKDNLQANLPKTEEQETTTEPGANPLVIVNEVVVSNARLKLNFENLDTGEFELEQKAYEVTLPTFNAGSIGQPNGMPADQVGAAIVEAMLDNAIKQAKAEVKKKLEAKAKEKLKEEVAKQKEKLLDKANDKLSDLLKK
ncbi:hypothetical protein ACOI22_10955 [Glaciecola sp. 2405UD65-10]|uniref:hypothetical protein n=1 Tax=Glaciecola sp. 2405UD65-10 TaxID=3397244 RepID=UPI003B58F5B7